MGLRDDDKQFCKQTPPQNTRGCRHTLIIPGKFGQIYEYDNAQLAVMFMPKVPHDKPVTGWMQKWTYWRKACEAASMDLIQNGDWEGTLCFDHNNPEQVRLAIRLAGIKRKRFVSEERAKELQQRLQPRARIV